MKNLKYILLAFIALSFACACSKDSDSVDKKVVGEWKLTSWSSENPEGFEVYIDFRSNGSYELYQKVGSAVWEKYSGKYETSSHVISGKYSDGSSWSADYIYETNGSTLTLTSDTVLREVSVYTKGAIPASVREGVWNVKSSENAGGIL